MKERAKRERGGDGETDEQTNRQTDCDRDREAERDMDRQIERRIETERQRQTDRDRVRLEWKRENSLHPFSQGGTKPKPNCTPSIECPYFGRAQQKRPTELKQQQQQQSLKYRFKDVMQKEVSPKLHTLIQLSKRGLLN